MAQYYLHLTYEQRLKIKQGIDLGLSKKVIAKQTGVHSSTVYREIDRGTHDGRYDPDYSDTKVGVEEE